ncbi:MAG: M48 family metallopeptidase [Treponema sp.]|nr:M48 family metallopeptidase [Treponema sp.]
MKRLIVLLALFLLFSITVHAQSGNAADALSRLDRVVSSVAEGFSPQDSYYIGRAVAANILSRYEICNQRPDMVQYLGLICRALTINSPMPDWFNGYFVLILDSDVPNAFSTPAGHIFLSSGLVNLAASEDMLAAALAHEIAHIQLRHGLAEIYQDRLINDLSQEQQRLSRLAESEISAEAQQVFTQPVHEFVNILFARGYSQLQEFEADRYALILLASAGYDHMALVELLRELETSPGHYGGLNNTHPLPSQRIVAAERAAARYRVSNTRSARQNRFLHYMENNSH